MAGYEGALAHARRPTAGLDAVRRYLHELAALHARRRRHLRVDEVVVTAGGSAYFDDVADVLAPLAGPGRAVLLRSGRLRHPRRRLLPGHLAALPRPARATHR